MCQMANIVQKTLIWMLIVPKEVVLTQIKMKIMKIILILIPKFIVLIMN